MLLEACVDSLSQALRAEQQGADRIELCADLSVGGLTPSQDLIKSAQAQLSIPIMVMIRPRAGDFCYSTEEIEQMLASIAFCKTVGVAGVVFGVTDVDNNLDISAIAQLTAAAAPLLVTIHKAIDSVNNPLQDLKKLLAIDGIQRVLTSGAADAAEQGQATLRQMLELAGDRITILAAGKVTDENREQLHTKIGAKEYHGRKIVGDFGVNPLA